MKPSPAAAALLAAAFALSACGGSGETAQSNAADQLREAAGASTPEAANVLENGAERIDAQGAADPAQEVQNVLQDAGNAQMLNPSGNGQAQ
ncbi:MAG TPA: hypothetical protein VGB79_08285 [Allosphingosinicella sp.]|jgi:hypothetical protein